jgi:pimeloyl-ACP methyl ester carboxylesterase
MKRRALLTGTFASVAGFAARAAWAKPLESAELELSELKLGGDAAFGRALLAVPRARSDESELLVLLHGLGETVEQGMGARAFAERYGLLNAVSRLLHPPVAPLDATRDYFGAGRTSEINAGLSRRPYRCPILVCPFTPNTYKAGGEQTLARFASFVPDVLKPEVEKRTGQAFPTARCMLAGVSLGGYLAIELFLKRPEIYCGVGSVQGAFGPQQAARYAMRVAEATERVGQRRVEVLTSSLDPYRRPNELFHQHLQKRRQSSRLRVSPGPHDQRWLNESGVIELLLAADDVFAAQRGAP